MRSQTARINRAAERIVPQCGACPYRQAAEALTPEERKARIQEIEADVIARYLEGQDHAI